MDAFERGFIDDDRRPSIVGLLLQPRSKPKARAFALYALNANFPMHQLDDLLANRQAQTGAAETPRCRCIGLAEGPKESADTFVGKPDARVLNLKTQANETAQILFA